MQPEENGEAGRSVGRHTCRQVQAECRGWMGRLHLTDIMQGTCFSRNQTATVVNLKSEKKREQRRRGWVSRHVVRKPVRETSVVVASYNVLTLAVTGRDGYGCDHCVLAKAQQLGCNFVGLQETRRQGETTFYAVGYCALCCGQREESRARQGLHGVGFAAKESICCKSTYSE